MDINFFDPIREKKKKTNYASLLFFAVMVLALAFLILFCMFKKMEEMQAKSKMDQLHTEMEDPIFIKQLESVTEKEAEFDRLTEKSEYLEALSLSAQSLHRVREDAMQTLLDELTESLYFEHLIIEGSKLSLDGFAADVMDVTQFEYDLRKCSMFEDIIVNTVQEEYAIYTFNGLQIVETKYHYSFNLELTVLDSLTASQRENAESEENAEVNIEVNAE